MRCEVCGCDPCETPGFCAACRKVDRDPKVIRARKRANEQLPKGWETMEVGQLWDALNHPKRHGSYPKRRMR